MAQMSKRAAMVLVALMVVTAFFPLLTAPAGAKAGSRANFSEIEPNNNYGQAMEIHAGDHVSGFMNWTDANDVFKINATVGKILNVTLYLNDYNPAIPYQYDLDYQVMDPEMYYLTDHWMQTTRQDAMSIMVYESGFHYIWVYANGTSGTHTMDTRYHLSVDQQDAISTGAATVVGNIDTATGSYTDAWYKLTIPTGQGVRANLTVPATGDYDLYLFTTWPEMPKYFVGFSCPYDLNESYKNQTGGYEYVEGLSMEGSYYIKVYGWSGHGAFSLKIEQASFFDDGDSTPATAVPVTPNKSDRIMMGTLSQSFDAVDWYKVHLNTGEYVNADLDLMTYGTKVDVLFGFTDQWFTTSLWEWTTVLGGSYNYQTNGLDGNAHLKFAPFSTGASVAGDYYFYVHVAWRMQDVAAFTPADTMYKLTWDLPDYGPFAKAVSIPPIRVLEGATNNSLNLNNYFGDNEGDTLSYSYSEPVNNPNVTVSIDQPSSKVTVTPKAYYNNGGKPINITFKATDAAADWGTKSSSLNSSIIITPVNFAPIVQLPIQNITTDEDTPNRTSPAEMSMVFDDPDGDHLIYRVMGMDHIPAVIDPVTTILTVGPVHQWFGTEVLTVQAEDTGSLKTNVTFKVTVRHVNHAPTPKGGGFTKKFYNMTENTVDKALNVTTMFEDPDISYAGDSLRYSVEYTYEHPENTNMKASLDGNFLSLKPANNWSGEVEVPIAARDLNGSKTVVYVEVTVLNVNQPPVILEASPSTTVVVLKEGELKAFTILKYVDSDKDETITYRWYLDGKVLPVMPTASTYTLETDYTNKSGKPSAGNYTLKAVVSDGELSTDLSWHVQVQNVNRKPSQAAIIEPPPAKKIKAGEKMTMRAGAATDPDGDKITYTWKDETTNTVIGTGDSVIYTPKGTGDHKISLTVSDGQGESTSVFVTITVQKAATAGLGTTMMLVLVVVIVLIVVILVAVLMMKRRKPKAADTQAEVASNYEAQLWGKQGGATRPAAPPPRPYAPPATPPRRPPPAQDYDPTQDYGPAAPEPPMEEDAAVPTWSPGGATVEQPTTATEPTIPKASASKVPPGPPR